MDEITTFNTAVVAADQALTDAQAAAQEHGNLSDEYWQALSAQYDAAQAVVAAFGVAYGDDDGPPSDRMTLIERCWVNNLATLIEPEMDIA